MPSPKAKGLEELFTDTLKDIYFAKNKSFALCPKWPRAHLRRS